MTKCGKYTQQFGHFTQQAHLCSTICTNTNLIIAWNHGLLHNFAVVITILLLNGEMTEPFCSFQ